MKGLPGRRPIVAFCFGLAIRRGTSPGAPGSKLEVPVAIYDDIILKVAREAEAELETRLASDVMYFNSEIRLNIFSWFRDVVEKLAHRPGKRDAISVCLTTTGGQAEAVEKLVEVIRHHYGLPTQDHLKPDGVSKCMVSSPDECEFVGC